MSRAPAAIMVLALACAGCGLLPGAPAGSTSNVAQPSSGSAAVAQAQRTHEYPGPPVRQAAPGASSPEVAVEAFATGYINWSATTIGSTMRALERLSVGQARAEVSLLAAQTEQDYELRRGGVANAGRVEAVAPLVGGADGYAVVTRERTTATATGAYDGLAPAWHLTLATVSRVARGRWAVSGWQPES